MKLQQKLKTIVRNRKDARKAKRQEVKGKRANHFQTIHKKAGTVESSAVDEMPIQQPLKTGKSSRAPETLMEKKSSKKTSGVTKSLKPSFITDLEDEDDKEIRRLEKLMKLSGSSKSKAASKLNKEYEMFEGIGGNFGSFLMSLDSLSENISKGKKSREKTLNEDNYEYHSDDDEEEDAKGTHHILLDDEQELSDVDNDDDTFSDIEDDEELQEEEEEQEEYDDINDAHESEENEEDEDAQSELSEIEDDLNGSDLNEGSENGSYNESEDNSNDDDEDDMNDDQSESNDKAPKKKGLDIASIYTEDVYRPSAGEDIYGRVTDVSKASAKYVPPAKRALMSTIDENSETVKLLRKSMTGTLNRLSSQTKDTTWRAVKTLYDRNSVTVCNTILRDCVESSCISINQIRSSMIPDYAAVIAALHLTVGKDVGAFIVENFTRKFVDELKSFNDGSVRTHDLVGNKRPINLLLILIYLYNLRILHHTLIVDIMGLLAGVGGSTAHSDGGIPTLEEHKIEMIVSIVDHCGFHLRADDPSGLAKIVSAVMSMQNTKNIGQQTGGSEPAGRMKFLFDALADLKNNKSRRSQGPHRENVLALRKWLGSSVKSTQVDAGSTDMSLHVGLNDLLNAEGTGRWWIAGASWKGIVTAESEESGRKRQAVEEANDDVSPEQKELLEMAKRLRFTTTTRKSIFLVTMSSSDVYDAFERLLKLRLPGNSDREIIRVLLECSAQEAAYNAFYAELIAQFCKYNRQHKTTAQYAIYDFIKSIQEGQEEIPKRKLINIARLFCHLVTTFDLPLSMMKRLELSAMGEKSMNLFLSTFFIALFTAKISEETFQNVLDRVATTKDFASARDNILYFLKKHLTSIPDSSSSQSAKIRRKAAVKTMEMMTTLLEGVSGDMFGDEPTHY